MKGMDTCCDTAVSNYSPTRGEPGGPPLWAKELGLCGGVARALPAWGVGREYTGVLPYMG